MINSACALTGQYGGFLMKILAATGECVWATDRPRVGEVSTRWGFRYHGLDVDAAGDYVYVLRSDDDPMKFDDTHTVPNRGKDTDGFLAKYASAANEPRLHSACSSPITPLHLPCISQVQCGHRRGRVDRVDRRHGDPNPHPSPP